MAEYLIKDTTKQQRIALIKQWDTENDDFEDSGIDIWEMYRDYIEGTKEIAECNAAFRTDYFVEG